MAAKTTVTSVASNTPIPAAGLPLNPNIATPSTLGDIGNHLRGTGNAAALPIRGEVTQVADDGAIGKAIESAVAAHVHTGYQSDSYRPVVDTLARFCTVKLPASDPEGFAPVDPSKVADFAAKNVWPSTLSVTEARQYAHNLIAMRPNMLKVRAKHGKANAAPAWRAPYWASAQRYLDAIACLSASLLRHKPTAK